MRMRAMTRARMFVKKMLSWHELMSLRLLWHCRSIEVFESDDCVVYTELSRFMPARLAIQHPTILDT
jgi:hypothetical protein